MVCIIDKNDKNYLHNKIIEQLLFLKDLIESSENLDLEEIKNEFQPINQIFVSEGLGSHDINFDYKNLKEGPLGFIVDNKLIKKLFKRSFKVKIFHLNTVQKYLTLITKTLTIAFIETKEF